MKKVDITDYNQDVKEPFDWYFVKEMFVAIFWIIVASPILLVTFLFKGGSILLSDAGKNIEDGFTDGVGHLTRQDPYYTHGRYDDYHDNFY